MATHIEESAEQRALVPASRGMDRPSKSFTAMNLNERLSLGGLTRQFDSAARGRDREGMLEVLARVAMPPDKAAETTDAILRNPRQFGY